MRVRDGDADLAGVNNGIALEDAIVTMSAILKVHTESPTPVALPTILDAGVANVHGALPKHAGVDALLRLIKGVAVSGDQDAPLEIHNLCRQIEADAVDVLSTAQEFVPQGFLEVQHARPRAVLLGPEDLELPQVHARRGRRAAGAALEVRRLDDEAEGGERAVQVGEDDLLCAPASIRDHCALLPSLLLMPLIVLRQHLDPVAWGIQRLAEVQAYPRDVARGLHLDDEVARTRDAQALAPSAPPRVLPPPPRKLSRSVGCTSAPSLDARNTPEWQHPLRGRGDVRNGVRRRAAPARSGYTDSVANVPAHDDRVVFDENLVFTGMCCSCQYRPSALESAAVHVDPGVLALACQKAGADCRVRSHLWPPGDVDPCTKRHRILRRTDLEVSALGDEQVRGSDLQVVKTCVPFQHTFHGQRLHLHGTVHDPELPCRDDTMPARAVVIRGVLHVAPIHQP
mmetsp:Transcript_4338/g.11723  ORF Transcript_4338/g.11723 Transcript_4338/m.11723 type:complete len:456 (+) Transcript_4338:1610-2977(+)